MKERHTNHDDIRNFFEYNLHIPSRTIFLGSMSDLDGEETGVNYSLAENFIKCMHVLEQKKEEIVIILNNIGGDYIHGMAIYDTIKASKCFVKIIVKGYAMSMGSVILQAGDTRIMSPHSSLMIHYGYVDLNSDMTNAKSWMNEYEKQSKVLEEIYLNKMKISNTRITRKKVKDLLAIDTIYNPIECMELGLIDEIL